MQVPSRVELSDIRFKDIRGTSSSPVAVALECSKAMPCKDIYLENVHLELLRSGESKEGHAATSSSCKNVRAKFIGTQIPPPCPWDQKLFKKGGRRRRRKRRKTKQEQMFTNASTYHNQYHHKFCRWLSLAQYSFPHSGSLFFFFFSILADLTRI